MVTPDPGHRPDRRALAAAVHEAVFAAEHSGSRDRGVRFVAALRRALADLDPLRVSLPPNPRQTNRAGVAPAGTPTKRIWPDD